MYTFEWNWVEHNRPDTLLFNVILEFTIIKWMGHFNEKHFSFLILFVCYRKFTRKLQFSFFQFDKLILLLILWFEIDFFTWRDSFAFFLFIIFVSFYWFTFLWFPVICSTTCIFKGSTLFYFLFNLFWLVEWFIVMILRIVWLVFIVYCLLRLMLFVFIIIIIINFNLFK